MQYSPKLKKAMEEIKSILKKYDIAGSIVLHTPGFSEYINHIDTSYSCAKFENGGIRVKSKGRSKQDLSDTVNMVTHFGEVNGMVAMQYLELKEMLAKKIDIDEDDGRHTSHTDQNN